MILNAFSLKTENYITCIDRVKQSSQKNAAMVITQDKESLVWLSHPLKKQNTKFLKTAKNNHKKS